MQKVLISGGAGFLGSHLCELLLSSNYAVLCVDNLVTGSKDNIARFTFNPYFQFLEQDVVSDLKTDKLDYIFHLASPASPNAKSTKSYIAHPIETLLVNSQGTYNLLELARKYNARFLYASSSEVYGDPKTKEQSEDYFGNVNPNGVRSVYDEGKRFGEAMTMGYFRKFGTNIRIVRIFNTYGPYMQKDDGRVVSNFINQAISGKPITIYGDGTQTRSFCYVSDLIGALQKAMFFDSAKGEVINIGNPDERSVLEIAKIIKQMTNSSSEIVFGDLPKDDPKIRRPNISKAKRILSWEPKVSLEEGLQKTIDYFKSI